MVVKAEQERIKTLLKDTITLLCRNGLTFKTHFSIEALIGITLDEGDVFLVSINEQIKPVLPCYNGSSDESSGEWNEKKPYHTENSSSRNQKRRRRTWSQIKSEPVSSDKEDDARVGADSLLDLSVTSYQSKKVARREESKKPSRNAKPAEEEEARDSVKDSVETSNNHHSEDEERTSQRAVIVKNEYIDESWPPAGVLQEVTVGGSDTNSETSYPTYTTQSSLASSSALQHLTSTMAPFSSSSRSHPAIAGLPMMNGMPFPAVALPQSHFAQALGHLIGSIPPSLSQCSSVGRDVKMNMSPNRTTMSGSSIYQPTSRSTLPKEAVALMTDWLRKNQHNPYPTDDIKDEFVRMTNLTYNQINYWFTNARRRLLPRWELQRKIEAQQLAERLSQSSSEARSELQTWMASETEESSSKS